MKWRRTDRRAVPSSPMRGLSLALAVTALALRSLG